jgi:hypothetical protein
MTPGPTLQELIDTVRADASTPDALDELAQASRVVGELETVGDALLGHFVDQCRRSGRSWSEISTALGVTRQAAHKRFSTAQPTFERFTPRARTVLAGAAAVARAHRDATVGSPHLLLALFGSDASIAVQLFADLGITRAACADALGFGKVDDGPPTDEPVPFSPEAIDVLRSSVEEALQFGHNYIGTEHLLLALCRDSATRAGRALASLGCDHERTRARLVELFPELVTGKVAPPPATD